MSHDTEDKPRLIIPQRVLLKIYRESMEHPRTETGEALIGVEGEGLVIILDTVHDHLNISRDPALFKNGGRSQADAYSWYDYHWQNLKGRFADNWQIDPELKFLGDWHKHPGDMRRLSGTDIRTIRRILARDDVHQILSPIVTHSKSEIMTSVDANTLRVSFGASLNITWYHTWEDGQTTPITPTVVDDSELPLLQPLPWFIAQPDLFEGELMKLRNLECGIKVSHQDFDGDGVLELVLGIQNANWRRRYVVVTKDNYPESAATVIPVAREVKPDDITQEIKVVKPRRKGVFSVVGRAFKAGAGAVKPRLFPRSYGNSIAENLIALERRSNERG